MPTMWSPALETGVREIDDQHRELFRRIDALLDAMMRGDPAETGRLLGFLEEYVVEHFAAEERQMALSRYPDAQGHRQEHEAFVRDFVQVRAQWQAKGPIASVTILLSRWVGDWLRSHITRSDMRLARHLKGQVVNVSP